MRKLIKLRDYQLTGCDEALAAWDRGERAHLLIAPTGAGKTIVQTKVAEYWHQRNGGRVLVVAQDSRELVRQLAEAFRRHTQLSVGIEMGAEQVDRKQLPVVVCATVQTMSRRLVDFKRDDFSLIVQDEADHAAAKSWRKISDHFWAARIFGCTATPVRHDGVRIPFDSANRVATHQRLIDGGQISPIEVRDVRVVDRKRIVLPSGDHPIDEIAIERIWKEEGKLHEIVEPTLRLSGERSTIVFAPNVQCARDLAAMFNRYRPGYARAIWGNMPRAERKETMESFQARQIQYIVNVGVLGRGIDLPFVSCVVMARVTQSRTVYEQAIGRGWRAHPDKDRLLVLDFCDNADRHRLLSTVALLAGREIDDETLERARERLDEAGGGDVAEALDGAEKDLVDPVVRQRVRAQIAVRTRTVDLLAESITVDEWKTKANKQLAREKGICVKAIRDRRPKDIPSPGGTLQAQQERARHAAKIMIARAKERPLSMKNRRAAMTPQQRKEHARKARSEAARRRHAAVSPQQRSETASQRAKNYWQALTPEQRSERMRKRFEAMKPESRRQLVRSAQEAQATRTTEQRRDAALKGVAHKREKEIGGDRKTISKEGAALEVTMLTLSDDAKGSLSVDLPDLGSVKDQKKRL